jgi:hypothetical protein
LIDLALELADALSDEDRDSLEGLFVQQGSQMRLTSDEVRTLLNAADTQPAFASQATNLRAHLWEFAKSQPDPPIALLQPLLEEFERLDDARRTAFVTQAGLWMTTQPSARVPLAQSIRCIPQLKATERLPLTQSLLGAEGLEPA